MVDFQMLRKTTPGCQHRVHFNNAGASLMPEGVINAMTTHIQREASIGGYEAFAEAEGRVQNCYQLLANIIGSSPEELAIVDSATRAWLSAFWAINWQKGDVILTSSQEYASNYLSFLHLNKRIDIKVKVLKQTSTGTVCLDDLRYQLKQPAKLLSLVHMPTNSGLIQPVTDVGEIVAGHSCLYLLDACQSMGQLPIDVREVGCDFLTATSRKYLRGPRGVGFLFVKNELCETLNPPWVDMRAATWCELASYDLTPGAKRFELWEKNYSAVLGFYEALRLYDGLDQVEVWKKIKQLANFLREELRRSPNLEVCDQGQELSGIVSFKVTGVCHKTLISQLGEKGFNISLSPIEAARIDMSQRDLASVLRASLHYYNTEKEVTRFCGTLFELVKKNL